MRSETVGGMFDSKGLMRALGAGVGGAERPSPPCDRMTGLTRRM